MTSDQCVSQLMDRVCRLLATGSFDVSDEARCQSQLGQFLVDQGITVEPEFRLDAKSRVDFYFPRSGIAIEVKAAKAWSKREVYRQCQRYCADERITGLILATAKAQGLPSIINGKPARVHYLGVSAL